MTQSPENQPAAAAERSVPVSNEEKSRTPGQLDMLIGVADTTSRIVQRAASILEEELASGIVAARQIERRFVDVEKIRSRDPEEVMQRFRRDAHEVVDILIDLVSVATTSLSGLAQRAITISAGAVGSGESPAKPAPSAGGIPALTIAQPVKPGERVEVPMTLENDSDRTTETFRFISSDLINPDGERIPAQQITFVPETITIEPHKSATITVAIVVPEGAPSGVYSGLLQATRLNQLRAVVTLQVA